MAEIQGIKWHIIPTSQRLETRISPTGNGFQDVWEVTYHIDTGPAAGTEAIVRIPADQYNAEVVKATVNQIILHNHNVASL